MSLKGDPLRDEDFGAMLGLARIGVCGGGATMLWVAFRMTPDIENQSGRVYREDSHAGDRRAAIVRAACRLSFPVRTPAGYRPAVAHAAVACRPPDEALAGVRRAVLGRGSG